MQSDSLHADLTGLKPKAARAGLDLTVNQIPSNPEPEPFVQPAEPLLAVVDEARIRCGMTLKEMAGNAEVNFGTFCDAMNGKPGKNFCIVWLDKQPITYRLTFAKLVSQKYGISKAAERALVIRRLFSAIEDLLTLTVVSE